MPGHFTFYSPFKETPVDGEIIVFYETEFKHAIRTLRYGIGDHIEVSSGNGYLIKAEIVEIGKNTFSAQIINNKYTKQIKRLRLYVGLLHNTDRMEWLVEKASELGVYELIFVKTDRSENRKLNTDRLKKIAIGALKQSHNPHLLKIGFHNDFSALISSSFEGEKYIAYCDESINNKLPAILDNNCIFLIGPEGDFSEREIAMAIREGYKPFTLGNTVLRTETAAISIAVKHFLG